MPLLWLLQICRSASPSQYPPAPIQDDGEHFNIVVCYKLLVNLCISDMFSQSPGWWGARLRRLPPVSSRIRNGCIMMFG
ncbi:hypothetical protein K504DRAFT_5393 [Pleomassaria siparia CBS 279.74]|uniref:Secreted protein n=1 Tax=Pleomassaria siparia CBS 279.74 TaxID=1314801 RepID=A0A6G1KNP2_9PLEO|nr:hypothetical protein K504DRAFT_5393 [Pleomassaria siparia CBS 279.74]